MTATSAPTPGPETLVPVSGFERASLRVNSALAGAAGIALAALMAFTALDVVMRALGRPIAGSVEIIGWLAAASMALVLGDVQVNRGHVAVTLLAERMSGRKLALLDSVNSFVALLLFGTASVVLMRYGITLHSTGSLSETLKVVVYPWVYLVAVGFAGLTLVLLLDLVRSVQRLRASQTRITVNPTE
jgi:TRAP-type C4-dicarboxylate transport system permease small subunit